MRPSDTKAAKRPKINKGNQSKYGKPHNVSAGEWPRQTKAAGRPKVNGSITGMKWMEQPNDYGKGV